MRVESFQQTIIVIEEVFWRIKSRITLNCKQSYFNSKASSVNLRFSKSASLQFFSHDAKTKTMQCWNNGFIQCDRSLCPFNDGRLRVVVGGPCDELRAGIGMNINFPGQPMSVTQHNFNHVLIVQFYSATHLHRFQVIECDI